MTNDRATGPQPEDVSDVSEHPFTCPCATCTNWRALARAIHRSRFTAVPR